jgi:RNA polymerase sigma-70 factor (ECF subfamily)
MRQIKRLRDQCDGANVTDRQGAMRAQLDDIFRATHRRLVLNVFAQTGDLREAEDAVQEAFVRAVVHSRRLLAADSPEAWLRTVARNIASNRWRRGVRLGELMRKASPRDEFTPELTPDRVLLYEAIRSLDKKYREVVALFYIADLSVEEIAATLGVATGTVKARLHRARATLRHRIGADVVSEADEPTRTEMRTNS